jgi:mannose-6-phosphate isomerase
LTVTPEPFRIEPKFVERIWGMGSLAPLFPEKTDLLEPIGEVWLTGVDCKVATGPFAGKTLGEAWREMAPEWRGPRFAEPGDFPILIKFIFPNHKLSIQVHPDDAYASAHEKDAGGRGKTEMWHVVSAQPGASLLLGLKPGVTKQSFLKALENQTLEELFERHAVQTGDTYFVPAGTPHTIGPDIVICEVQEYSDITYRVYDYGRVDAQGRPRDLHIAKALEVVKFTGGTGGRVATHAVRLPDGNVFEPLVSCPYFKVDRSEICSRSDARYTRSPVFSLWVFLSGEGTVSWLASSGQKKSGQEHAGTFPYKRTECWFIPPTLAAPDIQPKEKSSVLMAIVPEVSEID